MKLTFAGARSSLHRYVDGEIEEYKGDKSGIGYRRVPMDQAFTNVEIDAGSDDIFYAWSDGITDQVGGSNRRSFGKRRVCACIDDSHLMTMRQQEAQFLRSFLDHQMQEERRDDITFIGFKLKT